MNELHDIDRRSELFVRLTPENLARHVANFERTARTPPAVASLLAEARRTFVGASTSYDNLGFTRGAYPRHGRGWRRPATDETRT